MPPEKSLLSAEWALLSPEQQRAFLNKWAGQPVLAGTQMSSLQQDAVSLGHGAGTPPVSRGVLPEIEARPGISQTFPEWQDEAYGMLERIKPGMRRYQPPGEKGYETGYDYAKRPRLDIYPWVVTRAEEAARVGMRDLPGGKTPGENIADIYLKLAKVKAGATKTYADMMKKVAKLPKNLKEVTPTDRGRHMVYLRYLIKNADKYGITHPSKYGEYVDIKQVNKWKAQLKKLEDIQAGVMGVVKTKPVVGGGKKYKGLK